MMRPLRHRLLALLLGFGLHFGASAAPDGAAGDALAQLLAERGLLSPAAQEIVQNARDRASEMVLSAMNFLGVPYKRGGSSADEGFDCSGFTRHIFEMSLGLVLPRRVDDQATAQGLVPVRKEELKPGDLVFFNTLRRTFSHVGIYVGDGKFIHAPRSGAEVRVEDMRFAYWSQRFTGARRAMLADDSAGSTTRLAASLAAAADRAPSPMTQADASDPLASIRP